MITAPGLADTWVTRSLQRCCKRRAIFWAVTLGCAVLLGAILGQRYFVNFFRGPYELRETDLAAIQDPDKAPRYFVRVTGSRVIDTGIQEVTNYKRNGMDAGSSVTGEYYALIVGEHLLVCKSNNGPQTTCQGELASMPSGFERQLFSDADAQRVRARFYPFYVDGGSFRSAGYWWLGGAALLLAGAIFWGFPALRYARNPTAHPVLQRVSAWGDPVSTSAEIEAEASRPQMTGGKLGWSITDQYVIKRAYFVFDVFRLADLLWVYKSVIRQSVNYIPVGKTYQVMLASADRSTALQSNEKTVEDIIRFVAARVPWVVVGYTKEIEKLYKKNRAGFQQAVERRRSEIKHAR